MRQAIVARFDALSASIDRACEEPIGEHHKIDLRRYCVVLVCGFVERSLEVIVLERLKKRAQPQVLSFIKSHFQRGTNFRCASICELLKRFDASWEQAFDEWIGDNEARVADLNSAYSLRNQVAHGGTASVTVRDVRRYAESAKIIVDAVVEATK